METPETGMWGPGDYPADFVTLERYPDLRGTYPVPDGLSPVEYWDRVAIREAILDLAEDLDARGLFLTRINVVERQPIVIDDDEPEWIDHGRPPSSPNTGS